VAQNGQPLSLDEQAALIAEKMLKSSSAAPGDMPTSRGGRAGAEGGFTPEAGGKVIDSHVEKSTGNAITSEPGRQGPAPKITDKQTNEPRAQDGSGAGEPAMVAQNADGSTRARKPGHIGQSGGTIPSNLSEDEDDKTRARKPGKVAKSNGENDEDEDEDDMEKSQVIPGDAEALIKSLEMLEAIAEGGTGFLSPEERKNELAQKLGEGTLSKSEMQEFYGLLGEVSVEVSPGETGETIDPLIKGEDQQLDQEVAGEGDLDSGNLSENDTFQQSWAEDDVLQKGYEVSSFLERQNQVTAAALDALNDRFEKSMDKQQTQTRAFNVQLAKSLQSFAKINQRQGDLIKSLTTRLEQVESTPLPRKGISSAQALNKSMPGEVGANEGQLNRDQILDTLENMARAGDKSKSGHSLMHATAMFESSGHLHKSLYQDIIQFKNNGV
jgi:hypothetical protein